MSKADHRPLARARITVRDTKDPKVLQSMVTAEDGKFAFDGLLAGKFSLTGARRGFISASYDQHDTFSTSIVTGAGLDTETLELRLAPDAVIAGKLLDEFGEAVRHAQMMLYYDDHSSGVDRIRQYRSAQTNDLGEYEFTPLRPGTYFLSASGKPWYAVHPRTEPRLASASESISSESLTSEPVADEQSEATLAIDRSLDVAYPVTYYPDVESPDEALAIPIQGGERVEADIHLNPVPSLRLLFRMPNNGGGEFYYPQLQQPAFDGYTSLPTSMTSGIRPGLMEIGGIPAGRYDIHISGHGSTMKMEGIDLTRDGEEIDISKSDAVSSVKFSVQVPGESTLPSGLTVALQSGGRMAAESKAVDAKGEAELEQVASGHYEVAVWGGNKPYSIAHISAEGGSVSGHTLTVAGGASVSVSLTLAGGIAQVQGKVTQAGKGFAGAMVVLVPKNPEADKDLFRRDQSDLDGTFLLRGVVPGSYTLLAIENGWDLDWSHPGVISAYLKRGRKIQVSDKTAEPVNVTEAVEVQSK